MRTRHLIETKSNLFWRLASALVMLPWIATSAFASWPQLQDVEAGKETSENATTVWCKVYDPVLETWIENNVEYDSNYSVELTNVDGVVAWLANREGYGPDTHIVSYRVYDPGRGTWVAGGMTLKDNLDDENWQIRYHVEHLNSNDGVVCWFVEHQRNTPWPELDIDHKEVHYAIYDPEEGKWKTHSRIYAETLDSFVAYRSSDFHPWIQDGVLAWSIIDHRSSSYYVDYAVYDPVSKSWQTDDDSYSDKVSSLSIQDATVHYEVGADYYIKGYDPSTFSWYGGTTKPLAYFANAAVGMFTPLHLWFTDMSIGASSWEWDFGDGEHSSERSTFHTFSDVGVFTVTQTVVGTEGSDSATTTITTREFCTERTIYVDFDATGANNGSSWADAYNYLQDALADAELAYRPIEVIEIRVAQGTYVPDRGAGFIQGDRDASFQLFNYVSLKGGFAGFGEPEPAARDIVAYETVLSGDLNANDADVNDPKQLAEEPTRRDNSRHIVTASGTNETAVLDGFTIIGGRNNRRTGGQGQGAGMYLRGGSPTITNCTFRESSAREFIAVSKLGAGMYSINGSPTLTDCVFHGNSGGSMSNVGGNPILTRCKFIGNDGGGMNNSGDAILTDCAFIGNDGGGMDNSGDAILTDCTFIDNHSYTGGGMSNSGNPILTNCAFTGNQAHGSFRGGGGGIFNSGDPTLINCIFTANHAYDSGGGGMQNDRGSPTLIGCRFNGNSSSYRRYMPSGGGGGMYNVCGDTTLRNCIFSGNWTHSSTWALDVNGGAIYFDPYYQKPATLTLSNCTFVRNSAKNGNALGVRSESNDGSNITVVNCIFRNAGNEIWMTEGNNVACSITYSNVQGGQAGVHDPCEAIVWGEGNIDVEPLFAFPGFWANANDSIVIVHPNDPNAIWIDGDYHLRSESGRWDPVNQAWMTDNVTSPCIDAGDPNLDWTAELWPHGGRINMGAYGGTSEASMSLSMVGDVAYLNKDTSVDSEDMLILTDTWLFEGAPHAWDADRDSVVNFSDCGVRSAGR